MHIERTTSIRLSGEVVTITTELPGMKENDIEVNVCNDVLTIKAEKKERKKNDCHVSERHYGSFQRSFHIPQGVDANKIEASLKNGLLTVILPKTAEVQTQSKKINVQNG